MVSLRTRGARPSYTNVAEGLQELEDDAPAPGSPLSSGNSSAFEPGEAEGSGERDRDDADDLELEAEVEPEVKREPKTPGKKPRGGKAAAGAGKRRTPGGTPAPTAADTPKQRRPETKRGDVTKVDLGTGTRSTEKAYVRSSLNAFPTAYRNLLRDSSQALARGSGGRVSQVQDRTIRSARLVTTFPPGPMLPFSTKLAAAPQPRARSTVTVESCGGSVSEQIERRRTAARETAKEVGVQIPWAAWRGEGWWPELCGSGKGKGKAVDDGLPDGWRLREDIHFALPRALGSEISDSDGRAYAAPSDPVVLHFGPVGAQRRLAMAQFEAQRIDLSHGFLLATGGPVWGLDWCPYPERLGAGSNYAQYIAVATLPPGFDPRIGERVASDVPGSIQIWSVVEPDASAAELPDGRAACELVLCIDGGPVTELKWMPIGGWDELGAGDGMPKLGVVAAVQASGGVSLYAVPSPLALRAASGKKDAPIYIRTEPVVRLDIPDATATCIDWMSGSRIAMGLSNGHIAVFDVLELGPDGNSRYTPDPLPSVYTYIALSAIRSIAVARCAPGDGEGEPYYSGDAPYIFFASYDGSSGMVDVRDPGVTIDHNRARLPCMAVAWSSQVSTPVYADIDYLVVLAQMRTALGPATYYLSPHRGPIWSIGTSDYHTMVASGSSDGAVNVTTTSTGFWRRKQAGMNFQIMYELDYDEHTGEYRMSEGFLPESMGLEDANSKNKKNQQFRPSKADAEAPTDGEVGYIKVAMWPKQVGIHRVTWQSGGGIGRAGWLASAGYSGIVRVESVRGRYMFGDGP